MTTGSPGEVGRVVGRRELGQLWWTDGGTGVWKDQRRKKRRETARGGERPDRGGEGSTVDGGNFVPRGEQGRRGNMTGRVGD